MTKRTAAVVGAGIGGLTTALLMARQGWHVDIFEQAERLEPIGAGLQLGPNAMRILEHAGLSSALARTAVQTRALVIRSATSGKQLGGFPHGAAALARWGAPSCVIHRGDLQAVLVDALAAEQRATLRLGHRLSRITAQSGSTRATFATAGGDIETTADVFVGSDGLWSRTRGHIGLSAPPNPAGAVAWRSLIPAEAVPERLRDDNSHLWLAPGAHTVHYAVRGGKSVNVVVIVNDTWRGEGWSSTGDAGEIQQRAKSWTPDLRQLIAAAPIWQRWALFDRAPDPKWSRGCVTLVGDAAHPMLPCLAQGAAQAIEDAAALAAALGAASNVPGALQAYERARISHTARVQRRSRRQLAIYHASGPIALARNIALRAISGKAMMASLDWLYAERASPAH